MTWYGPADCEDNCCEPPCEPPIVTCRRYEATEYDDGYFEYDVSGAEVAWISEICGETTTIHHLVLVDGAVSGSWPATEGCNYCVYARTGSCEVNCCDTCTDPECYLNVKRVLNPDYDGTNEYYLDEVEVEWSYAAGSVDDVIVSATVGGVDVFGDPLIDSGSFETDPEYLTYTDDPFSTGFILSLIVTNNCGKVSTCTYIVPCCWVKDQIRVSISGLTDISEYCETAVPFSIPSFADSDTVTFQSHELTMTGLTAANGTHLFNLRNMTCDIADDDDIDVGEATFFREWIRNRTMVTSGVTYTIVERISMSFTGRVMVGPTGTVSIQVEDGGRTHIVFYQSQTSIFGTLVSPDVDEDRKLSCNSQLPIGAWNIPAASPFVPSGDDCRFPFCVSTSDVPACNSVANYDMGYAFPNYFFQATTLYRPPGDLTPQTDECALSNPLITFTDALEKEYV